MNYEWVRKTIKKKIRSKKSENSKNQRCEQKSLARKRIFVQTPFSHSTLKLELKNFTPQNHSLFRSASCFGVTKITTPNWLQKIMKMCEQIKKSAPINSNSLNCKRNRSAIIAGWEAEAATNKLRPKNSDPIIQQPSYNFKDKINPTTVNNLNIGEN